MWDVGKGVQPEFFTTASQVFPVLFFAALVESRAMGRELVRRWADDPTMPEFVLGTLRTYGALFFVGEGAALYATATGSSSTTLVLTPCFAMVATLYFMYGDLESQIQPPVPPGDKDS